MANFNEDLIQKVWEMGRPTSDSGKEHKDECGAWIARPQHGERDSAYEWGGDPISPDGPDLPSSLSPLHWRNNIVKRGGRLICVITSSGV